MKNKKIGKMLVPAGCLIGIGVGMIFDQVGAGTLIGLGAGFVALLIYAKMK